MDENGSPVYRQLVTRNGPSSHGKDHQNGFPGKRTIIDIEILYYQVLTKFFDIQSMGIFAGRFNVFMRKR